MLIAVGAKNESKEKKLRTEHRAFSCPNSFSHRHSPILPGDT